MTQPLWSFTLHGGSQARRAFDYVVVQQPAILEDRGFLRFAASADAVLLIVEEGRTGLDDLARCRALLDEYQVENAHLRDMT